MNKFIKYLLIFYSCVPFVAPTSQSCCCFKKTKVAPSPAPKAQAKPAVKVSPATAPIAKTKAEVAISTKCETESHDHRYYGITSENFLPPQIQPGLTVLDIGAGDGIVTKKVVAMVGKDKVTALEPDQSAIESFIKNVGNTAKVQQKTLQQALKDEPQKYQHSFDVVTIFKYNVPLLERDEFFQALHKTVKPNGTVYITSVEKQRFNAPSDVSFLIPTIEKHFIIQNKTHVYRQYDLITLKPK